MIEKEIEYELKKNKNYNLYTKKTKEVRLNSKILNITICPEISHLLISTKYCFYKIYTYNEFLLHSKSKYVIMPFIDEVIKIIKHNSINTKQDIIPKIIFEINPNSDERMTIAVGINKTIMLIFLSKKKQIPYEIEHKEDSICKFIQWENDLLICAFENKIIKIIKNNDILKTFKDDDYLTAMKVIHYQDFKLLVTGYNKKVIIRKFYSILNIDNEFPPYIISKLEGKIDIIEFNNQYILFCSKKNNIIYCYRFLNNNWKPTFLFEINKFKNAEEEQEIINVKLIPINGIAVSTKRRIYLFYIKNNKKELNYILKFHDIYFFTLLSSRKFFYYYCLIGLKTAIKVIRFEEIKKTSDYYKFTIEEYKKSIDTWINTLLNRKNEFTIKRMDYMIKVEMDDIVLKVDFNLTDKLANISIIKCEDYRLKAIIEGELEALKNNEEENEDDNLDYLTEELIKLHSIIKSFNNRDSSISEENIEKNNLLKIEINQFLDCYKIFKNWKEIVKKKNQLIIYLKKKILIHIIK